MRQDKHIESERTLGFYHLKLLFETENATYSLNSKPCFDIFSSDFNEIGFLFNHLLSPCPTTLHTPHTHPAQGQHTSADPEEAGFCCKTAQNSGCASPLSRPVTTAALESSSAPALGSWLH